jgi:hypothetical protein
MGFSYRRSVGIGPFRINISRSGIGWSVGGRGVRTGVDGRGRRYTNVSIPGTGVSYRGKGCLLPLLCVITVGAASAHILGALA